MDYVAQLPSRISSWLLGRGITDEILREFEVGWNGSAIVLPIHDGNRVWLFNKYRRDPEVADGPKYTYDKGGVSQLYGLWKLKESGAKEVVICEGELDCLVLWSKGIPAVTTTSGSGSFDEVWGDMLAGYKVFLCYDDDEPGIKGSLQASAYIDDASIIWIGHALDKYKKYGRGKEMKDMCDYFKLGNTREDFLALCANARRYFVPLPSEDLPDKKKDLTALLKKYKEASNAMLLEQRELLPLGLSVLHAKLLVTYLEKRMEPIRKRIKYCGNIMSENVVDRLKAAKDVSIERYIEFRNNTARCIWHDEDTPSMHYYRQSNKVHCFGCSQRGDVLDVVMQLKKVGLQEAINTILNVQ